LRPFDDRMRLAGLALAASLALVGWGDPGREKSRQGLEHYKAGELDEALSHLQEAQKEGVDAPELDYDLGVVQYRRGKYQDAGEAFSQSLRGGNDGLRARGYYNLGNALFQAEDYAGAAGAYRRALELAPEDVDAKFNLELALKRAEQQPPQQKQPKSGEGDEKKDRKEDDQGEKTPSDQQQQQQQTQDDQSQQSQDQQDQKKQEDSEKPQSQDQQQPQQANGGEKGEQPPPDDSQATSGTPQQAKPMSEEDARRLLDALKNEEARLLEEKEKKRATGTAGVVNDW
jgi:Ca-activated chloride channel family protein